MPIFAPKIFSNDPIYLQEQVFNSMSDTDGLEIALYGYNLFTADIEAKIKKLPNTHKILHMWQNEVALLELSKGHHITRTNFEFELNICEDLDIKRAVIHHFLKATPHTIEDTKKYAKSLVPVFAEAYSHGVILHTENVFKPFPFFEEFYNELDKLDVLKISGLCLDTGHARLYNGVDLETWLTFIKDISSRGASIHYHIHVNDGTGDQHKTLSLGNVEGLLEPIDGWTPNGYLDWFKRATKATPKAIFCQEHSSTDAPEAMGYIRFLEEDGLFD